MRRCKGQRRTNEKQAIMVALFSKLKNSKTLVETDLHLPARLLIQKLKRITSEILRLRKKVRRDRQRRSEHHILNKLYWKDRKAFWQRILHGCQGHETGQMKCNIPKEDLEGFFKREAEGMSSTNLNVDPPSWIPDIEPSRPRSCTPDEDDGRAFDEEEFYLILKKTNNKSAPGWDGITYSLIKQLPNFQRWLFVVFECCRRNGVIPNSWKAGHVSLLYKKGDPLDCGNWRPICLQSCIYKLYSALLAHRLTEHHKKLLAEGGNGIFSLDQRGFIAGVEGCNFNGFILQEFLQSISRECQNISAIWIDFRNAFGSIDHLVIQFCMEWLNVPRYICIATCDIYDGAQFEVKFELNNEDHWTTAILLERGVKQGCGFSPLIFNCCLELLLRWLNVDAEVKFGSVKFAYLAYADDIVLVCYSKHLLELQFTKVMAFGNWANLHVKPTKCACLALRWDKSKNKAVPYNPKIMFYGAPLPHLTEVDHYRFLGTETDPLLRYLAVEKDIRKCLKLFLNRLSDAPVDAWMKLEMLRTYVFPGLVFPLTIANLKESVLRELDVLVRKAVRGWLSLPPNSSVGHFYAPLSLGGLNLKSFVDEWKKLHEANLIKFRVEISKV